MPSIISYAASEVILDVVNSAFVIKSHLLLPWASSYLNSPQRELNSNHWEIEQENKLMECFFHRTSSSPIISRIWFLNVYCLFKSFHFYCISTMGGESLFIFIFPLVKFKNASYEVAEFRSWRHKKMRQTRILILSHSESVTTLLKSMFWGFCHVWICQITRVNKY